MDLGAMGAPSSSNGQQQRQGNRRTMTCYNCGKKGHIARFCRAPKRDDKGKVAFCLEASE